MTDSFWIVATALLTAVLVLFGVLEILRRTRSAKKQHVEIQYRKDAVDGFVNAYPWNVPFVLGTVTNYSDDPLKDVRVFIDGCPNGGNPWEDKLVLGTMDPLRFNIPLWSVESSWSRDWKPIGGGQEIRHPKVTVTWRKSSGKGTYSETWTIVGTGW